MEEVPLKMVKTPRQMRLSPSQIVENPSEKELNGRSIKGPTFDIIQYIYTSRNTQYICHNAKLSYKRLYTAGDAIWSIFLRTSKNT